MVCFHRRDCQSLIWERFLIGSIALIIVFGEFFIAFSLYSWTVVLAGHVQVSHLASLVV